MAASALGLALAGQAFVADPAGPIGHSAKNGVFLVSN